MSFHISYSFIKQIIYKISFARNFNGLMYKKNKFKLLSAICKGMTTSEY